MSSDLLTHAELKAKVTVGVTTMEVRVNMSSACCDEARIVEGRGEEEPKFVQMICTREKYR